MDFTAITFNSEERDTLLLSQEQCKDVPLTPVSQTHTQSPS